MKTTSRDRGRLVAAATLSQIRDTLRSPLLLLAVASVAIGGCLPTPSDVSFLHDEVVEVERAFARTMADRDHEAFTSFLAADAIFFDGDQPVRGRRAIAQNWHGYFEGTEAPFSWAPKTVAVLESGSLALSTGPVLDPSGACIATFTSIWRLEKPGAWRIVFDRGSSACD